MDISDQFPHDIVIGKPVDWDDSKGECKGLPVKVVRAPQGGAYLISAWKPTEEEIAMLRAGETVKLWVLAPQHPVVMMTVGPLEPFLEPSPIPMWLEVCQLPHSWSIIQMWYNPDMGGFSEPFQKIEDGYKDRDAAIAAAKSLSEALGMELRL